MTFKSTLWRPIAVGLSVINIVAGGFAALQAQPLHATAHVVLALAFGLWAQRLRRRPPDESERDARLDVLEAEVSGLQQELSETKQGLDFAERLLAHRPESVRVDAKRDEPPRKTDQP